MLKPFFYKINHRHSNLQLLEVPPFGERRVDKRLGDIVESCWGGVNKKKLRLFGAGGKHFFF